MGGIVRSIFGGSSEKSDSHNVNNGTLLGLLQPGIQTGQSALGTLGGLLGLNGQDGSGTMKNFLDSTGFKFIMDQGQNGIVSSKAAQGLLRSGSTAKDLVRFNQNTAKTFTSDLMDKLANLGQIGTGQAAVLADSGRVSSSSGSSQKGIFNALFPGGLSDARLKTHFKPLGVNDQGLDIYSFEFRQIPGVTHVGVIAQDVQEILPEAVYVGGDGLLRVNYALIDALPDYPFTQPVKELANV